MMCCDSQNCPDCCHFHNWCECFNIIYTAQLPTTLSCKTNFGLFSLILKTYLQGKIFIPALRSTNRQVSLLSRQSCSLSIPGCQKSMLLGEEADLNETGTSCVTSACDNRLNPYRRCVLLILAERRIVEAASVVGA